MFLSGTPPLIELTGGILIDHHANVNLLMRSGKGAAMTPLDAALHKGNSAVAKFLQLHGGIPSSSLNDVSLQRRLNRSVEGQISPASSMQGSHLGSHHHPSPDEHQRTFISPDVFDHTLGTYSRNDFSKAENHPTIASSTPIMDDGVQTDPRYTKDMEVQVSDSFEEAARKSELSNSHRKSERRRRRKSRSPRQDKINSSSNSSSSERSSNQLTSRTSRKSSRKSTKDNSAASGSKSKTSGEKSSESIETKNGKIIHEEKPEKKVTTQESSDTMQEDHDNTLRSEKFSELENVAVQSSETDAREEELASDTEVGIKEVEVTETQESINTEKENSVPATEIAEIKESKTKTKELSRERKSKSKTPTQLQRERSASAKSHKTSSLSAERRSRSASAESRSSSAHQNEEIRKKEKCKTGNKTTESENEVVSPPVIQSGKASNVSFNDKKKSSKTSRNRSKSAEDRDRKSRSKSKEGTEKTTRNRSKSATERRKETPKLENVEIKKQSKSRSSSAKKDQKRPKTPKEETTIYDEIEAGKSINLQEAALKRQESLSRDPSRSRSRSISITRHTCESTSTILKSKAPAKSKLKVKNRRVLTTSEEREIQLQEALLGSSKNLRHKEAPQHKGKISERESLKKSRTIRNSSEEHDHLSNSTLIDSGFSDNHRGVTTSTSEELRTKLSPQGKQSYLHVKRRVVTRRPGSGHGGRKTIFSSSPKNFRGTKNTNSYDTLIVHQMSVENGGLEDEAYSTSTRGSVTSEEAREQIISPRRKKIIYSRPRSKLTFSRNDNNARASPKPKKIVNVETQISVTQAMQASMRKYNLERMIFHELLELKRLQVRAGKANEQLLIKRLAENYKRAGYSVSFKDFDGPFTFRNFEKYLYDQLRLLQTSRKVLPRFAPSDDIEKLSTALKKMNSAKLPYLDDAERSESVCSNLQCTHTTHRCHHAAHAYTGVPCAAYIGNRKTNNGFLPRVNPLKAPGPLNLSSPMNISISPRTDTQSPITLEVQQGSNTQVFTLPTKTLDPSKNYYVSLSIKPNPTSPIPSPVPSSDNPTSRPPPMNDVVDDGSISAPPPPVDSGSDVQVDNMDRDKHNRSM